MSVAELSLMIRCRRVKRRSALFLFFLHIPVSKEMIMQDLLQCAWRELDRRRGRTLANVLGYTLAVALMVILVSLLIFSRDAAGQVLSSTGTHFMAFNPLQSCGRKTGHCFENTKTPKTEGFIAAGAKTKLMNRAFMADIRKLPAVKDASAFLLFRFQDPLDGHLFTVGGYEPQSSAVRTTCCAASDIIEGRFLTAQDTGSVVLEQAYAITYKIHAGNTITIANKPFQVVGVVNPGVRPAKADVYMHFNEAERLISTRTIVPLNNEMNILLVEVKSSKLQKEAIAQVRTVIPDLVVSSYACWKPAAMVMGMTESSVWVLTGLLCLFTIVLALRSQWASLIERRHDIGILKAIGWTNRVIVRQMLTESLLQALIGGVLGCLLAWVILLLAPIRLLIGIETPFRGSMSPFVPLIGLALALAGGIIAGIFPALSAARQTPAAALRQL